MIIRVYGSGCAKCSDLAEMVSRTAEELNIDYSLEKVTDLNRIVSAGIMLTPALEIDGRIVLSGNLPSPEQMRQMLERISEDAE
jgi:small redox-active disulfide protein 2